MPTIHELVEDALSLQKAGNYAAALAAFRTILARDPEQRPAQFGQAFCLQALGRIDDAQEEYRKIINLDPFLTEAYINLSGLLEDDGNLTESIAVLQQCLKARPNNPLIWHRLGGSFQRIGDRSNAEGCYRRAWEQNPQLPILGVSLANVLFDRGDVPGAESLMQDVIRRHPTAVEPLVALGVAAQNRGEIQKAATWYERAIAVDPKQVEARLNLASLVEANGQIQAAQRLRLDAFRHKRLFVEPVHKKDLPRVLVLEAPEGGFASAQLFAPTHFAVTRLVLIEGEEALPPALPPNDILVVALPYANHPLLGLAQQVVARLGLPTITPPDPAKQLTREQIRARSAGIDRLRTLIVTRVAAHDVANGPFPLWVRPVGLTSVRQWVMVPNAEVANQIQIQLQLAEYDTTPAPALASPDGVLRIYRLALIGGELRPYRLLASRAHLVDPSGQALIADERLRAEEQRFLSKPAEAPTGVASDALYQFVAKLGVDVAMLDIAMDGPEAVVVDVHTAPPLDGPWSGPLAHRAEADAGLTAAMVRLVNIKRGGA